MSSDNLQFNITSRKYLSTRVFVRPISDGRMENFSLPDDGIIVEQRKIVKFRGLI